MISIRKNLIVSISCILIVSTIIATVIIFYNSHDEASEVFDSNMIQIAKALSYADGENGVISKATKIDEEEEILIQIWKNNELEYSSHPNIPFLKQDKTGYGQAVFEDHNWRYYASNSTNKHIQVAQ